MYSRRTAVDPIPAEQRTKMTKTMSQKQRARNGGAQKALRRVMKGKPGRIRGKGNFFSDVGDFAQDIVGGFIHPGDLGRVGGRIGTGLGNTLGKVTGLGDYTIRKNSIVESMPVGMNGEIDKRFSFSDSGSAVIRVKKREYLGQVLAGDEPGDFQQIQYRLQATDTATFPWLSQIGELFTEWRLIGAIMSFESTSSNYSSTVGLGTIALATQYNSNMLPYADMDSVLQSAYHTRGNPSEDLIHGIECDPKLQASERLYTRRPGAEGPPNLYDHGVVTVATQGLDKGMGAGTVLGRVYLTYEVELSLPELPVKAPYQHAIGVSNYQDNIVAGPPLGKSLTIGTDSASQMSIGVAAGANILLLSPAAGPLVKPTLTPQDDAELCAWLNDSSATDTVQYMSFARSGHYMLEITRGEAGGAAFVETDTVIASMKSTSVSVSFSAAAPSAGMTDHTASWYAHIDVTVAGGSVTITNAHAASDAGRFTLTLVE